MAKKKRNISRKVKAVVEVEAADREISSPPVKKSRLKNHKSEELPVVPVATEVYEEETLALKAENKEVEEVEPPQTEPEQPINQEEIIEKTDGEDGKSDKLTEAGSEAKSDASDASDSSSDSSSSSSDSDSSDSDAKSAATKEETPSTTPVNPPVTTVVNSVTNSNPVKSYATAQRSSSSDSYHSDTEEEDKKRRKKQKRIQRMQLNKKVKRSGSGLALTRPDLMDEDEDGGEHLPSNCDADMPDWPEADFGELLRRMEALLPPKDNLKFDSRAAKLDWTLVRFKDYSADECYDVWGRISKRIRRFRTLNEMLGDAKDWITKPWTNFYRGQKKNRHPDMPARPLSTYMIYYLEHKDRVAAENPGLEMTQVSKIISEQYKNLSAEEREKLTGMAAKERAKFDEKLSDFYKEHPDMVPQTQPKTTSRENNTKGPRKPCSPFKLFYQEQLKRFTENGVFDRKAIEDSAKEKWRAMNDKKKLVWINWALEDLKRYESELRTYQLEHPEYVPPVGAKSVLNKDERCIKERLAGKPLKPPNSAYSYFSRVMLQSDEDVKSIPPKLRMAEISRKWREISDAQKQRYEEKVKELQEQYKLEFASYLEGLPEEEREEEIKKTQPKRRAPAPKPEPAEPVAPRPKRAVRGAAPPPTPPPPPPVVNKTSIHLYKNEPIPPPVRPYDLFLQNFLDERPIAISEARRLKEAPRFWELLSEVKKEVYRKELREMKQKYISDYEHFLKGLSPVELKEFSVLKAKSKEMEKQKEMVGRNNSNLSDSNEDSESEKADSSSDESSTDGKSTHSSSSSDSD